MDKKNKQYGLIIPGKKQALPPPVPLKRPAGFDEDDDSNDSNNSQDNTTSQTSWKSNQSLQQKQSKAVMKKALEEDPTVFQYDSVYDEMEAKSQEKEQAKKADKKPRYITALLKTAELRKRENEWRTERKVQKEREEEGDEFADKESFVTQAYRQKMEEMQDMIKEEEKEAMIENLTDVTKQSDLSGFYRHLYKQQVVKEEPKENENEDIKSQPEEKDKSEENKSTQPRNYRKRNESESSEESDKTESEEHNNENDADTSLDDSDEDNEQKQIKQTSTNKNEGPNSEVIDESKVIEEKIEQPKVDVYKKRTVGDLFLAAQQRYHDRCQTKLQCVA